MPGFQENLQLWGSGLSSFPKALCACIRQVPEVRVYLSRDPMLLLFQPPAPSVIKFCGCIQQQSGLSKCLFGDTRFKKFW